MISTAPRPSRPDQPIISTVRFGDSAVVSDPHAYTTQPIANARLRPTISPTFPPVIISDAITSVYIVIAVWIPVTVVSRSSATVAMAVFITVVSRAITNWPAAKVARTAPVAPAARPPVFVIAGLLTGPSIYGCLGPRLHGTGHGRVAHATAAVALSLSPACDRAELRHSAIASRPRNPDLTSVGRGVDQREARRAP